MRDFCTCQKFCFVLKIHDRNHKKNNLNNFRKTTTEKNIQSINQKNKSP